MKLEELEANEILRGPSGARYRVIGVEQNHAVLESIDYSGDTVESRRIHPDRTALRFFERWGTKRFEGVDIG